MGCSPAVQRHHNHEVWGPIPAAQAPLLRQHLWAQLQSMNPGPDPVPVLPLRSTPDPPAAQPKAALSCNTLLA